MFFFEQHSIWIYESWSRNVINNRDLVWNFRNSINNNNSNFRNYYINHARNQILSTKSFLNYQILKYQSCCRRRWFRTKHRLTNHQFLENDFENLLIFSLDSSWKYKKKSLKYEIWVENLWRCRRWMRKTTICSTTITRRKLKFWIRRLNEKNEMNHNSRRNVLNVYISLCFDINLRNRYFVWRTKIERYVHYIIKRFQHKTFRSY